MFPTSPHKPGLNSLLILSGCSDHILAPIPTNSSQSAVWGSLGVKSKNYAHNNTQLSFAFLTLTLSQDSVEFSRNYMMHDTVTK